MPEIGPCAPARTLVAVRAMVPVTQIPPNSAEPILAMPCATSSQFDRCRRPVMPSATTADNKRFDGAEQREGNGIRQDGLHFGQAKSRAASATESRLRNAPEAGADGFHRQRQRSCRDRAHGHRDQNARPG